MFFTNTFKRVSVLFHVHETTGVCVPLNPLLSSRVKRLRAFTHGAIAAITRLTILSHSCS